MNLSSLQWKEKVRSPFWQKSIGINIVLGFVILLMSLYLLAFGFLMQQIIEETNPGANPIFIFNGIIVYYFMFDLILRDMMQNLPALSIRPLLVLPFSRKKLFHHVLRKTIWHLLNWLPFLVFLPIFIRQVLSEYSAIQSVAWLITIVSLVFGNNFLTIYLKSSTKLKSGYLVAFFALILGAIYLDKVDIISLSDYFRTIFNGIHANPALAVLVILYPILFYILSFKSVADRSYLDKIDKTSKKKIKGSQGIAFLEKYGRIGQLINLELKLITRSKRPKQIMNMSILFLLYGLLIYPNAEVQNMFFMKVFVAVFLTGLFMIFYGQFLFAWESSYFDYIISNNITFREMIESKYYLFVVTTSLTWLLTIPYVYFGREVLYYHTAIALFNIGINSWILFWVSTFNVKRIDLGRAATFNYQGVSAAQFLLLIPLITLPMLIVWPFRHFGHTYWGLLSLAILGILGFLMREVFINALAKRFTSRKYKMSKGFRTK